VAIRHVCPSTIHRLAAQMVQKGMLDGAGPSAAQANLPVSPAVTAIKK